MPDSSEPFIAGPLQDVALPFASDRAVHHRGPGLVELHSKAGSDTYFYVIDMRRYLEEREFVTSASATVTPVSDPAMAVRRMEYGADAIAVWLSGGADEVRYTVDILASTNRRRNWLLSFAIVTHGDAEPIEIIDLSAIQLADGVGAGIGPLLRFTPASISFPFTAVGATSAPIAVLVECIGTDPVSVQSIGPTGPFTFTSNADGHLAPGETFGLSVRFTPVQSGTAHGSIVIDGNTSITLPLSGAAT